jgi:glycopeptide antibiotics resistance protein
MSLFGSVFGSVFGYVAYQTLEPFSSSAVIPLVMVSCIVTLSIMVHSVLMI